MGDHVNGKLTKCLCTCVRLANPRFMGLVILKIVGTFNLEMKTIYDGVCMDQFNLLTDSEVPS